MRFLAAAGLVMLLSGLAAFYTTRGSSAFAIANLIAGPLLLIAAGVAQTRRVSGFSGAHSRRVVVRCSALVGAVTAAVILVNIALSGSGAALDLTADRQYTLADQSAELCREIGELPVEGRPHLLFFEDALIADDVKLLVAQYDAHCDMEVRWLQGQEAPPEARAILASYETTVIACVGTRCEPVGYPSEGNITNSLLRLTRMRTPVVYFLVGHGEVDLASEADRGYSSLAGALRDEGFDLRAYVGPTQRTVPADADAIVIAAPERDLLPGELEALDAYLTGGGRLLVLLEPDSATNLHELLVRWGFGLPDGIVADERTSPLLDDPTPLSLLVNHFSGYHPVTRKLNRRHMVLLPSSRVVTAAHKPQRGDELQPLVYSTRSAWLESDLESALGGRSISADPEEPGQQPLPVAAAGRYPRGDVEARIVVFGDRDFASNRLLPTLYNRDLALNAILWLTEDEERIALRPKGATPDQDPLTIHQTLAYFYFLAFALPEALLLLGIHAWYRQRT